MIVKLKGGINMEMNLQFFGGRGSNSLRNNKTPAAVSNADNGFRTDRNLYSKEQVDSLTQDYTPKMFLGDVNNEWMGTGDSLRALAEQNMPKSLNIGGYTFNNTHGAIFRPTLDYQGKYTIVRMEYQATEQVGKEYPILQVGIRVWRTRGGKVKSEIIRDGYLNKTRFL